MKNRKYKFIGMDGSLGYRKGQIYNLKIRIPMAHEYNAGWIIIIQSPNFCPYRTIEAFLDNWEYVRE